MTRKISTILIVLIILSLLFALFITILIIKQTNQRKAENNRVFYEKTQSHLLVMPSEHSAAFFDFFYNQKESHSWPGLSFTKDDFEYDNIASLPEIKDLLLCRKEKFYVYYEKKFHPISMILSHKTSPGYYFGLTGKTKGILLGGLKKNPWLKNDPVLITTDPEALVLLRSIKAESTFQLGSEALWSTEDEIAFLYRYNSEKSPPETLTFSSSLTYNLQKELKEKSYYFELLNRPPSKEPEQASPPDKWHFLLIRIKDMSLLKTTQKSLSLLIPSSMEVFDGNLLKKEQEKNK